MDNHSNPNPIREYYIAYFDILGYRQLFKEQPEKAETLLSDIHYAIGNTKRRLSAISDNKLFKSVENADLDFMVKIFSDNFFICLERHTETNLEKSRALILLEAISEIQRNFILAHNLFVRGGVTIGSVSFNDDYIFGQGLIDAVELEEKAVCPRIAIAKPFCDFILTPVSYTPEELERGKIIEKKLGVNEKIAQEDKDFYSWLLSRLRPENRLMRAFGNMVYPCGDGIQCLSYLYKINPNDYMDSKSVSDIIEFVKQLSPDAANELSQSSSNMLSEIEEMLRVHKILVEDQIRKYGNYNDIELCNRDVASARERILKKYLWTMSYHNNMCTKYNKNEFQIHSIANCDARFMLLMVNIFDLPPQNISNGMPNEKKDVTF